MTSFRKFCAIRDPNAFNLDPGLQFLTSNDHFSKSTETYERDLENTNLGTHVHRNSIRHSLLKLRSSRPEVFCKKGVLRNFTKFTGKHLCQSLFFNKVAGQACNFIKKETLAQVFSCEFCEISKNTFFYRTPLVAASESSKHKILTIHFYLLLFWMEFGRHLKNVSEENLSRV